AISLMLFQLAAPVWAENEEVKLTGDDVASITHMFLRNHYARLAFDDVHSKDMLQRYLDGYDPGRYYFLQSDIAEFRRDEKNQDDLIRRGNIDLAFAIFNRFKQRMEQREHYLQEILRQDLKLSGTEKLLTERKQAPYPANDAEARTLWMTRIKFEVLELTLGKQTMGEAKETLRKRYRSLHFRLTNFRPNDIVSAYLNAFTASFDPHSSYMPPDELENFNITMSLSLEGIGATLRWEDGYTVITTIVPGGAAAREGTLQPEDKITGVGQGQEEPLEDVTNMRLSDVVKLIRGERGTLVRLAFLRKGKGAVETRHEVVIRRDRIVLKDGEASGAVKEITVNGKPQHLGVIELPSFYVDFAGRQQNPDNYKSAYRDVKEILARFVDEKVDGVVLDLRNNGGGGLDEAVALAGLFLPSGPMVLVRDLRGQITPIRNPAREVVYRGPLVVLVNRYSASASEIVAGALQDYGRAVVVGDRATFGKGTVQNIIQLRHGLGALKTTVAKFYRPGSSSTQNRGVESDVVLPSLNNYLDIGESALDNAMLWDTVQRQSFEVWGDLEPLLPMLRERSRARVAKAAYFQQVESEIKDYLKNRKNRKEITPAQLIAEHDKNTKVMQKEDEAGGGAQGKKPNKPDEVLTETLNILGDVISLVGGKRNSVATGQG
ncbi:MAG: carboxy terminal-processing peptidase, partial [Deltaproteobacteria bacterium]|nr:carboxy terminal-processing peptidase [Deltaproteobacteria bacterium]